MDKFTQKIKRDKDGRGNAAQPGSLPQPAASGTSSAPPPSQPSSSLPPIENLSLRGSPPPAAAAAAAAAPSPSTGMTLFMHGTDACPPSRERLASILQTPAASCPNLQELLQTVEMKPPSACPVCYNLNPYQAPSDDKPQQQQQQPERAWARQEYILPAGTRIAKFTVDNSKQLIDAAAAGCLYCTMIRTALGAVAPGWETEKTFLHVHLAPGLPVVVRLEFGTMSKIQVSSENAQGMGITLREGEKMELLMSLMHPTKKSVDVEIFRQALAASEVTVGHIVLESLIAHMGFATEIPSHADDVKCIDFIKSQLADCSKNHSCGLDDLPELPDRVLWLEAGTPSGIQLIEPDHTRAQYVALSYCWGPVRPDTFMSTRATLVARKAGIRFEDLPSLFQDVVRIVRTLGIDYLWIDRLCILQGDAADFGRQAPKMGDIYGRATLTIAAAAATSEADRILAPRDRRWAQYELNMAVGGGFGSLPLRFRQRTHALGSDAEGGDYGRLSTRAWIWQERLLSARTVFFTPAAIRFECRRHSVWEGFGAGVRGHSWSARLDSVTRTTWTTLVEEYMSRDITRASDRMPAMEAVMRRIAQRQGWSPLWGMWTHSLLESLGWQSGASGATTGECNGDDDAISVAARRPSRPNPGRYAPTWSWASVDGPITYVSARPLVDLHDHDPPVVDLELRSLNTDSGLLVVAGLAVALELRCQIKPEPGRDGDGDGFARRYQVLGVYADKNGVPQPFPVHADVPLRPRLPAAPGSSRPISAERVPHGEPLPITTWTAPCLCLLVSRMEMRAICLFLGVSPGNPRAWERIGMVDGIPPAIFGHAKRTMFNIL